MGKFWNQVNGELELKDRSKAEKFITKNLIYIFPSFLSKAEIINPNTHLNGLLVHYRSLLIGFDLIEKEIGSNKYFLGLVGAILEQSRNGENKGSFVE